MYCSRYVRYSVQQALSDDSAEGVELYVLRYNARANPDGYTLSLHDALPICSSSPGVASRSRLSSCCTGRPTRPRSDRKSTRLNSSHLVISYAVFCLKKKIEIITGFKRLLLKTRIG